MIYGIFWSAVVLEVELFQLGHEGRNFELEFEIHIDFFSTDFISFKNHV